MTGDPSSSCLRGKASPLAAPAVTPPRSRENLRVLNAHCVLEVEGDLPTLRQDTSEGLGVAQELRPGEPIQAGIARLCLQSTTPVADSEPGLLPVEGALAPEMPTPTSTATPTPTSTATPSGGLVRRDKRLVVVDGADQGRRSRHPNRALSPWARIASTPTSSCTISTSPRPIAVRKSWAIASRSWTRMPGTQLNGKNVRRQEMIAGDILRIGEFPPALEVAEAGPEIRQADLPGAEEGRRADRDHGRGRGRSRVREVEEDAADDEVEPVPTSASEAGSAAARYGRRS